MRGQHATCERNRTGEHLTDRHSEVKPIRQLIKVREVARKLGVSISWVAQHASGKRKPYLPAVKMGAGRSPLRFDPSDVETFIDDCVLQDNAQDS
jgi:predicted DNA-binding transcriptional regulator AlpA